MHRHSPFLSNSLANALAEFSMLVFVGLAGSAIFLGLLNAKAYAQNAPHEDGYLYLSPVPGAAYVSAQTRFVLIRFVNVVPTDVTNLDAGFITVTGALSGVHAGRTSLASDGRTVIYRMTEDFHTNELVNVSLNPQLRGGGEQVKPFDYRFMVTGPMPEHTQVAMHPQPIIHLSRDSETRPLSLPSPDRGRPRGGTSLAKAFINANGVSVPGDFPLAVITVNSNPSPGYLFLENALNGVPPYTMILDNNGLPLWYRKGRMYDFKIQKNGLITWCLRDGAGFPACDTNFNYVRTYTTVNGYLPDGHELKVLPNGHYLMIGYRVNPVDLSRYFTDGNTNGSVRETVVQEFTGADELILQWRAWDNYDIRLSGADFPHMNGIDTDEDGNILVSARHLNEVTKINRDSGDIIWRLSGNNSSFSIVNDSFGGMSWQHNITALGRSRYLSFDNGDTHTPQVSRAVEYELDLTNMTATLVWEFRDSPDKYAYWLGSAQRLPTGNTLINFALSQYPKVIEVDAHGVKHFELSLVPGADAYRAFRFPWNGVTSAPYLILERQENNITLVFNKFGDTNVAFYRIYAGTNPEPTQILAVSPNTLMSASNLVSGRRYYFRVTAFSRTGVESDFSNEESLLANVVLPGQQMVLNGDFTDAYRFWDWQTRGGAAAQWEVAEEASYFDILTPGTTLDSIQLWQAGKSVIQGRTYVFEFDAWATKPRYIEAMVGQQNPPGQIYSSNSSFLTANRRHFRYVFTMKQDSDFDASIIFNLGTSNFGVYLDNVSLFKVAPGDFNRNGQVDFSDLSTLTSQWLLPGSTPSADLNNDGKVDFQDFGIFGDNWGKASP